MPKQYGIQYDRVNGLISLDEENARLLCEQIEKLTEELSRTKDLRSRKIIAKKIYERLGFGCNSVCVKRLHPEYYGKVSLMESVYKIMKRKK